MSSILALLTGVLVALGGPVKELRIAPGANTTEVVVTVDGEVEVRDFTMEGPNRLVLDLSGAQHQLSGTTFRNLNRGGIRSINTSQFTDDVVRVVLELEELVPYDVFVEDGRVLVAIENRGATFEPWSSVGVASPRAAAPQPTRVAPTQVTQEAPVPRLTITFVDTPISDVIFTFGEISGRSIIKSETVTGNITARINDQPWDEALDAILTANGFIAEERDSGIIWIIDAQSANDAEAFEALRTVTYPVNYLTADEIATSLTGVLSEGRGQVSPIPGSNAVVVTDIARVHRDVSRLIEELDVRTPSVSIQAKIIFVNRTDLNELGITYDLKDSSGNQLNVIAGGASDLNGDGVIDLPDEAVEQGTNVVSLGGNSLAALGNANARLPNPTLTLLSSLVIGRHTLVNFIEALESSNLSDIQAEPYQTVLNNQPARIQVGERTPLRVLDAASGGGGGGGAQLPQATVNFEETGIILETTPTVTNNGEILLTLHAERSAPIPAESDVGFIFATQNADSRVLVRDGETVVIGGLTVTEFSEVRSGIPMLMNLPLIGKLFRTTRESLVQRDLIILVTPTIVRDLGN